MFQTLSVSSSLAASARSRATCKRSDAACAHPPASRVLSCSIFVGVPMTMAIQTMNGPFTSKGEGYAGRAMTLTYVFVPSAARPPSRPNASSAGMRARCAFVLQECWGSLWIGSRVCARTTMRRELAA